MSATLVECVIARSESTSGNEDAWVSLRVTKASLVKHVVVIHFKHKDFGLEAFARAVKYSKAMAKNLSVPFLSKRAPGTEGQTLNGSAQILNTVSLTKPVSTRSFLADEQSTGLW